MTVVAKKLFHQLLAIEMTTLVVGLQKVREGLLKQSVKIRASKSKRKPKLKLLNPELQAIFDSMPAELKDYVKG